MNNYLCLIDISELNQFNQLLKSVYLGGINSKIIVMLIFCVEADKRIEWLPLILYSRNMFDDSELLKYKQEWHSFISEDGWLKIWIKDAFNAIQSNEVKFQFINNQSISRYFLLSFHKMLTNIIVIIPFK